ncbi:MAG: GerA spore germination protein [Paenibacillus sp.]|jgi:spore germination protein KA|nr:GerA spore germination protein [Paenibacillus sp.]
MTTNEQEQDVLLSTNYADNMDALSTIYNHCADVVIHEFMIAETVQAAVVYIEDLSNELLIDQQLIEPLVRHRGASDQELSMQSLKAAIPISNMEEVCHFSKLIDQVSSGNPVLIMDGSHTALALGLACWEKRGIDEPVAESVIRGPREGFTETIGTNLSMIRRRIRSPMLKVKKVEIGRYTKTTVALLFIEGIAEEKLVEEVERRIYRIDIDGVLESGNIEELIEDNPYSPFPQIISTERPDTSASGLLEGRVVIMTNGTPFALIAPITIFSLLQTPEDYYQRFWVGTVIRYLRYIFVMIALLIPSAYVAILTYHQEMIPSTLLLSIAKSREEIPFPAVIEAFMMEIMFEALREAGVRLPKQVGAAVSIVGALVIGQAATSAGLVSAPMVMVVAITGIASFMIPHYTFGISIRMLRFPIMLLAGNLGLLGLVLGVIALVVHLSALRSFGVPYLSSLAPTHGQDLKDVLMRAPLWMLDQRPQALGGRNKRRQAKHMRPGPPQENT